MATPLSAGSIVAALRAEGVRVVEVAGWRTHNRNHKGAWGPVHGVMIHHTVTSGAQATVNLIYNGHSQLPGPLALGCITKDGTVHLVGNGRANHAGSGDDDVLKAVIAERATLPAPNENNTDGNARFYGFECENLGNGQDPWPPAQLDAIVRASAALCRAHGWTARSVIGHKEWTNQKIDPRGFTMNGLRAHIQQQLTDAPEDDDMALTGEDKAWIENAITRLAPPAVWNHTLANPHRLDDDGNPRQVTTRALLLSEDGHFDTVIRALGDLDTTGLSEAQVQAIADRVAAHPALTDSIAAKVAEHIAERLAE